MLDIQEFDIEIEKIASIGLLSQARSFTGHEAVGGLATLYDSHDPAIATQMFMIKMYSIPLGVSEYFKDTSDGRQHYTRPIQVDMDEVSPVNHMMILNASHLIELMRRTFPDTHTALLVEGIVLEMQGIDPALSRRMKLTAQEKE